MSWLVSGGSNRKVGLQSTMLPGWGMLVMRRWSTAWLWRALGPQLLEDRPSGSQENGADLVQTANSLDEFSLSVFDIHPRRLMS